MEKEKKDDQEYFIRIGGNRIAVKREAPEGYEFDKTGQLVRSGSGLAIANTAYPEIEEYHGEVLAYGPEAFGVHVGDFITFGQHAPALVKQKGKTFWIISLTDLNTFRFKMKPNRKLTSHEFKLGDI